jgi:hypothetical protein
MIAFGFSALVAAAPHVAMGMGGGEAGELEHARANARAGGPLNARDAELLARWGCLSGTKNSFCERPSLQRFRQEQRRGKYSE